MLTTPVPTSSAPVERGSVAVLGAGLMGHAISAVLAGGDFAVACLDPDDSARSSLRARVSDALEAMGADRERAALVRAVAEVRDLPPDVTFVVEAAPESVQLKQDLLADVGAVLPHAVLATNTSVFRVADVAVRVEGRQRVVGTHWWNPPNLVPLVEVVQGEETSAEVVEGTIALLRQLGKFPVHVKRDTPGFVGNRLQHAMWREAMAIVEEGVCDPETVDLVVRKSFGLRLSALGPIENADYVGLDLTRSIHDYVFPSLSRADRPLAVLDERIASGALGAKTGRGFLEWTPERRNDAAQRMTDTIRLLLANGRDASAT